MLFSFKDKFCHRVENVLGAAQATQVLGKSQAPINTAIFSSGSPVPLEVERIL